MNKINIAKKIKLIYRYPKTASNLLFFPIYYRITHSNFSFPIHTTLYVTEKCNLDCPMCLVSKSRAIHQEKSELTLEDWEKVIDQLKSYNPTIYITGGEPLLNKDIFLILDKIKRNNLICGMTTNGLLLEKYSVDIINSNIDFVSISIDGNQHIHDKIRGRGTYDKTVSGIKKLVSSKKDKYFPNIKIGFVTQENNINDIEYMMKLASELSVDELCLQHLSFYNKKMATLCENFKDNRKIIADIQGVELDREPLSYDKIENINKIIKNISYYEKEYGINISFTPITNSINKYYSFDCPSKISSCRTPWNSIQIRADGSCELCDGLYIGNIKDKPIKDIFNSKIAKELRNIIKKDMPMPYCFRCCRMNFRF